MKNIIQLFKIVTLALILSFGLSYVYAWTAPTQTPPLGNVAAPINTSSSIQYKNGAFGVGGIFRAYTELDTPKICLNAGADSTTNCITAWPVAGATGAIGATGPQGPAGTTGATGPQGPAGTSGGGRLLLPWANTQISCTGSISGYASFTAYAKVDAAGNPFTKITSSDAPYQGNDSGWVSGFSAKLSPYGSNFSYSAGWNPFTTPNLSGGGMAISGGVCGDWGCPTVVPCGASFAGFL